MRFTDSFLLSMGRQYDAPTWLNIKLQRQKLKISSWKSDDKGESRISWCREEIRG